MAFTMFTMIVNPNVTNVYKPANMVIGVMPIMNGITAAFAYDKCYLERPTLGSEELTTSVTVVLGTTLLPGKSVAILFLIKLSGHFGKDLTFESLKKLDSSRKQKTKARAAPIRPRVHQKVSGQGLVWTINPPKVGLMITAARRLISRLVKARPR